MSRPMTRRYLKRIGVRPEDIWPYEMEEAKLRAASALSAEGRGLRATGGRVSFRMAAALLDEARRFQRGRVTAEAVTAEATTAEAATADSSGGAPEPPCQSRSGTVPEANVTVTEATAEATITEATAAPIYAASS